MSNTSARRSRLFGVFVVSAGALGLASIAAGGCGGSVDGDAQPAADSGADTALAVDTTPADAPKETAPDTSAADTTVAIDAPGSLFDVDIPDIAFEGGTAAGCYDCTKDKCKAELTACDADAQCRSLVLCLATDCAGDITDTTCLFGCAAAAGVTSPTDPVAAEAIAVGQCSQKNCADKCPGVPTGTDGGTGDAKKDGSSETGSGEAGSGETGGAETGPAKGPKPSSGAPIMSVDPKVIEGLQQMTSVWSEHPALRQAVIDRLTH